MTTNKRIREKRKKRLRDAIKALCQATGSEVPKKGKIALGVSEGESEEISFGALVEEGASFFGLRRNAKPRHVILQLEPGIELAFSSRQTEVLRLLINTDFSAKRRRFAEIQQAWQKGAPTHIQRSFQLDSLGMDSKMFIASER